MKFIQSFFHQQILLTILSLLTISKSATAATPSELTSGLSGLELFFLLLASSCLGIGVYYLLGVVLSLLMRTLKAALDWLTETSQRSSLEQLDAEKHLPPSVIRQLQELEEYKDIMTTNEYAYQKHLIISKYVGGLSDIENERQSLMEARNQELIKVKEAFAEWQNKVWRERFTWVWVMALLVMVVATAVQLQQDKKMEEFEAVLTRAERLQNKVAERKRNEAKQQYEIAFVQHIGLRARMATESPSLVNGYVDQSFLLAVQAFRFLENLDTQSNLLHFSQSHSRLSKFLRSHRDRVTSVAFSPNGLQLASGSLDNSVILWNVKTGKPIGTLRQGHSNAVTSVAFSPAGPWLASGSEDNSIILWDIKTGKAIGTPWQGHSKEVTSVAFSPDGLQLASGSYDNSIILWDVKTGTPIGTPWYGHNNFVNSVAFSPDGLRLASGSQDKSIILWDVKTGTPIGRRGPWQWRPWQQGEGVLSVAFSPDGLRLASGSWDNSIILWNVNTGEPIGEPWHGHSKAVWSVTFSPDGLWLASGSGDKSIILWNVKTYTPIGQLRQENPVHSVAFSPDGKLLASDNGKNVTIWDVDPHSWAAKLCQKVNRNFTQEEWRRFFGERDYENTCLGVE